MKKIIKEINHDKKKKEYGLAIFSLDKKYRYLLSRKWSNDGVCTFILLNPSTADAFKLDPTVTRAYKFAKRLGYGELVILNVFAIRGSNPKIILSDENPIGELNNKYIKNYIKKSDIIILGWGNYGKYYNRSEYILNLLKMHKNNVFVIDINKNGEPKHILYTKNSSKFKKYNILHNK